MTQTDIEMMLGDFIRLYTEWNRLAKIDCGNGVSYRSPNAAGYLAYQVVEREVNRLSHIPIEHPPEAWRVGAACVFAGHNNTWGSLAHAVCAVSLSHPPVAIYPATTAECLQYATIMADCK